MNRYYTNNPNEPNLFTAVYWIYNEMEKETWNTSSQFVAAAAVILLVVILVFTLIELAVSKKKVVYK